MFTISLEINLKDPHNIIAAKNKAMNDTNSINNTRTNTRTRTRTRTNTNELGKRTSNIKIFQTIIFYGIKRDEGLYESTKCNTMSVV